jgi:hypothetical protein
MSKWQQIQASGRPGSGSWFVRAQLRRRPAKLWAWDDSGLPVAQGDGRADSGSTAGGVGAVSVIGGTIADR